MASDPSSSFRSIPATGAVSVDESLLTRARALESIIRQHADATERQRRLARPVIDAMREAGMFRLFMPRSLGGFETDPVTVACITEETGYLLWRRRTSSLLLLPSQSRAAPSTRFGRSLTARRRSVR